MSAANTRHHPDMVQNPIGSSYKILREVDGDRGQQADGIFAVVETGAEERHGKEWALKLFDTTDVKQMAVFDIERNNLHCIGKLREGKGALLHIIQAKEMFEDAEGWGCIIMPLEKESLKQRM